MRSSGYSRSKLNFILQQGYRKPTAVQCGTRYRSLLFQPRVVGIAALAGVILQSPTLFLVLGLILWWGAALPQWNVFESIYNRTAVHRSNRLPLSPAPAPRRFAQGLAGTVCLVIAGALLLQWRYIAFGVEAFLLLALIALTMGRFCFGSFVYHLARGRPDFARKTLPWSAGDDSTG